MGNLANTIKRFITDKNTVTILAVIAGIIVLWYFYTYRINQAITTVEVPYATVIMDSGKIINMENIGYKEITSSTLNDSDMITDVSYLEGKYICEGTNVPTNGFFYESQICEKDELSGSIFDKLSDGETIFNLALTGETGYDNRLIPGRKFILYMRTEDEQGRILSGPLFNESIEILAITDSSGADVYWDSEAEDAENLLFIASEEKYNLLMAAIDLGVTLYPVVMGGAYTPSQGETYTTAENLQYFIKSHIAR